MYDVTAQCAVAVSLGTAGKHEYFGNLAIKKSLAAWFDHSCLMDTFVGQVSQLSTHAPIIFFPYILGLLSTIMAWGIYWEFCHNITTSAPIQKWSPETIL